MLTNTNKSIFGTNLKYPWEVIKKCHELGLLGLTIPQKYGGMGLGCFDNSIVSEEMSYGCTGMATAIQNCTLGVNIIRIIL